MQHLPTSVQAKRSRLRMILPILLFVSSALFVSQMVFISQAFAATIVIDANSDPIEPAIYGSKVVWIEHLTGPYAPEDAVYVKDISSSSPTFSRRLNINDHLRKSPSIYGDKIVWVDGRNGNDDIYMFDLSQGLLTETQITNNPSDQEDPDIYGNNIVWTDYRNGSSNPDIYMYDLSTNTEKRITTSGNAELPRIYGDKIVWEDWRNGNADIYMYNLSTQTETQITNNPSDQEDPDIYGNNIVWTDYRNGSSNPDIYMYDLSTNTEKRITTSGNAIHPRIYGNTIAWEDWRNGNADIYSYDLSTQTETQITNDSWNQEEPAIYGDKIAWTDYQISSSPRIFMYYSDETPPVTTYTSNPSTPSPYNWYNSDVTLSLSATDNLSGVSRTEYTTGYNSDSIPYTQPLTLSTGSHTIFYRSIDEDGNIGAWSNVQVNIDKVAPVTTFTITSTTPATNGWYPSDVTFSINATDDLSGVAGTSYNNYNSGSSNPASVISSDGIHTIEYWSIDKAGNVEQKKSTQVKIDKVAPVTTASLNSSAPTTNGWYHSDVTVSLAATDSESGVAKTEYQINNGDWTTYTAPFTVSIEGTTSVNYRSTDQVGNVEQTKSLQVNIDKTPPTTSYTLSSQLPSNNGWYAPDVKVSLSATDNYAWDRIEYRVNGSDWTTYTAPFTPAGGINTIECRGIDHAGNVGPIESFQVKVDATPPITTYSLNHPPATTGSYPSGTAIAFSATDDAFGVDQIRYNLDNQGWQTYDQPLTLLSGDYTFSYYSVDKAGNAEAVKTVDVNVLDPVTRMAGSNRYNTSAEISKKYPIKSDTIVLAVGNNFPDALAGAPLATIEKAPILLTNTYSLPSTISAEITRRGVKHAILLGGEGAISAQVVSQLKSLGVTQIDRYAGSNRYETSDLVAQALLDKQKAITGTSSKTAIIVTGKNYPDALSASSPAGINGYPILLVSTDSIPTSIQQFIQKNGITNFYIVGGTGAVSTAVENQLKGYTGSTGMVKRLSGTSRYTTALQVAKEFWSSNSTTPTTLIAHIAYSGNYPDALSQGALAAYMGAPLLLTPTNSLDPAVLSYLQENPYQAFFISGGLSVVSQNVENQLHGLVN